MPSDFDQLLKDLFGESVSRITQFSTEQTQRLQSRLQEMAREALKDEFTKLHTELNELRTRVATLEAERVQRANDMV